jgi:hypothetical protein
VKIKYIAIAILAVMAISLSLLFLWKMELILADGKIKVPSNTKEQVMLESIYAEFNIEPEAGILTGDILRVSLGTYFDYPRIEVDESLVAEEYITLKEVSFSGCEEYTPPKIESGEVDGISYIFLSGEFQCWPTKEEKKSISAKIQYVDKENSKTSTLAFSKKISFAAIPVDNKPKEYKSHVSDDSQIDLWITSFGVAIIIGGIVLLLVTRHRIKTEKSICRYVEPGSHDYFIFKLTALKKGLAEYAPEVILDKLYHLCLEFEEQRGENAVLEETRSNLRKIYNHDSRATKNNARAYIDEVESIMKNGGDAK